MARDKPGGAAPAPKGWSRQKQKPFKIGASQSSKGGLQKNIGRRSYGIQYGDFSSLLFRPFASDGGATYLFLTNPPWRRPPANGAFDDVLPAPNPTRVCHRDSSGQGFGLVQAIWAVERGGFDVMLLTETKIFMMAYCWIRIGYNVTCSASRLSSAGRFHGGVGLVMR